MTCRMFPTDGVKLMKLKCDLINMLLVITNGQTVIPVEKARDEKK